MLRKPWLLVLCVLLLVAAAPAVADTLCKPAAPLSQSKCVKDAQCCAGLVCQAVSGVDRCQPACRIGGAFYKSGALNPSNNCQSCQPAVSTTRFTNLASGTSCSDGNACTRTDTCQSGVCTGSSAVVCTALDQCHLAGVCSTSTGVCSNPTKASGTTCNDGNACSRTDTCQSGICTGSNPVVCSALDQCHIAGVCSISTGICSEPNKPNGASCSDGTACTRTDTCQSGICTGSNPVLCAALDQCHVAGVCNSSTGGCSNPYATDGTGCNDGNACTQADTCRSGSCIGNNPVLCAAADQCHVTGTCNTSTGACSNPSKADGSGCSDGNACTQADTCVGGVCTGSNPVVCTPLDPCHVAGICNTSTGGCSNPSATDGTSCSDGFGCTQPDVCQAGVCTAGAGNPCLNTGTCAGAASGGYACFCPTGATGVNCESCANGYTQCASACAVTQSDVANCGQCGTACATGEVCSAGNCVIPVPAQLAFNLPDGFSPVPGGHAAQPFTVSVVDSTGQSTGITGDFVTIRPGGQVIQGQCTLSTGTCAPPNYLFGPFCCEPDTNAFTISGCELSQLTINGAATFSGCIFTGPSGGAVSGAILQANDTHYHFLANRSFDISTGGCQAQVYSFLVSTRGFGCSRSGPPPTSSFDPLSCASPSAPACCTTGGCQPDSYNVQSGQSGIYDPVPASVLLYSPQSCDPVHQPQNCTLAHPSCFLLCFSNDPSCVSPYPPCQAEYPARGFGVPYNGNCSVTLDDWHFAECLQDAQWPTYHAPDGTAHQGTVSAGSGECTVSVNAPTGDIVVVGTLGDHWQVSSHGTGYSSCVGVGGPNGDGVQRPDCSELEISYPSVVAGRPSCSDGLACPGFSTAQGNGSATDVYTVYCVP